MTGGGLIALVSYGTQNIILSGNPQISFFHRVFRRYTHFAIENITTQMEGADTPFFDQPIKLRLKIERNADLISNMNFCFQLPDIYSKYTARGTQYEFQWVPYVGCALIQNAAFFIGGQKMQEFDGAYLLAHALLDSPADKLEKWKVLVGNTPELTNPAQSTWTGGGGGQGGGYPTVVKDTSVVAPASQNNRPSIFGQTITVPLPFWFAEPGNALPLVALQQQECEVQLTLQPLQQLYTVLDLSGYRVRPGYQMNAPTAAIAANLPAYAAVQDLSGEIRAFLTDIGYDTPRFNSWNLYPRIQTDYVYLTKEERNEYAATPMSFLVHQVTNYSYSPLTSRRLVEIYTHNPVERLIFLTRRTDSLENRNAFDNFSNWWSTAPPYKTPVGVPVGIAASGVFVPNAQREIIQSLRVLCNGTEIQEEKPIEFFSQTTALTQMDGNPRGAIPVYAFTLGSPSLQPKGSINTSVIRVFEVDVNPYPLPANTTYVYDLNIVVENINFVEVAGGAGGLKYAL